MKVKITVDNFVFGTTRIAKGAVLELPPMTVNYLETRNLGKRVTESDVETPPTSSPDPYVRQDMKSEEIPSTRPKRTYRRRDKASRKPSEGS